MIEDGGPLLAGRNIIELSDHLLPNEHDVIFTACESFGTHKLNPTFHIFI